MMIQEQVETHETLEILLDFSPYFTVYKDGSVQRSKTITKIPPPPCDDPLTGVRCKDVLIAPFSARIFMPPTPDDQANTKLAVVVYYHGGGFCQGSAFSRLYHSYVSSVAARANVLAISVEYRLAPEFRIPACYDDALAAVQWLASHANGKGPDPWVNSRADLNRVFLVGDSAGGNIMHNAAVRAGQAGIKVAGLAYVHPFFGGSDPKSDTIWWYLCPENEGLEDPRIRPGSAEIGSIKCDRIMIFVTDAARDEYFKAGMWYYGELKRMGYWGSDKVELVQSEGVGHIFHLFKPKSKQAEDLMDKLVSFIKGDEDHHHHHLYLTARL